MSKKGKSFLKILTGAGAFAAALTSCYFLTPNKVKKLAAPAKTGRTSPGTISEGEDSHFMKFITRLTQDTGIAENESKEYYGVNAAFENFSVSFKKEANAPLNYITVDGGLDFMMRGLKDLNFNLYADVNYNGYEMPIDVGYVDKTAYLGFNDLRIKAGSTTLDELRGNEEEGIDSVLYNYFIATKEDGGINFNVEKFLADTYLKTVDTLIGKIDLSNLTSSFKMGAIGDDEVGIGLLVTEFETEGGYEFDINAKINTENTETNEIDSKEIAVVVAVDKVYHLTKVDLGTIEIGNIKIEGAIKFNTILNHVVKAPDDVDFVKYDANHKYVEVINYKGWLQKLAHFLDEDNQKIGLDFALNLATSTTNKSLSDIGSIEGSINADFSEIIDLSNYVSYPDEEEDEENPVRAIKRSQLTDDLLNKASFGIDFKFMSKNHEEYGNLAVKYTDGEGYIDLNQSEDENNNLVSVMKAKVDTETINWIMDKVPEMVSELSEDSEKTKDLFSFITDSSLVTSIKEGNYSSILGVLKNISNDDNGVNVDLDLSSLGLGDNAQVSIALDSRTGDENKVINLSLNNVFLGSLAFNAEIESGEFKEISISHAESYDSLAFLPTVVDQVSSILDTKQAGFTLEGSLLDGDNIGFTMDGQGQFDYGNKLGFGTMTIDEYKYKNKGVWYSHKLAVDVDNTTGDFVKNSAYFVYGDPNSKNVKGKVTVQSVLDLVDIVKTFIGEAQDDPRWNKFVGPIMEMLSMSQLSEIIKSNDYFKFLKNDLIKSINKTNDVLSLCIGGSIFNLATDINIKVHFVDNKIDSLELVDLGFDSGKTLNLKVGVKEYDTQRVSPVNKSASYIDLSTISLLLKYGIKTTESNYYHLSAKVSIDAFDIFNLDTFDLHVYIVINGEYVKIYGTIPDAKISSLAQDYIPLVTTSLVSEFTFETYPDNDPNKADGVGGYFHFKTTRVDSYIIGSSTTIKHYKTTSKNLLEGNNIVTYLLDDFLVIKSAWTSKLSSISLSNNEEEKAPGDFTNTFTSTGFKYTESQKRWDVGLNLNELTGISALKDLEIKLYGGNNEKFTRLWAKLNVANILSVEATIDLEDTASSITDWSSSIQSKFTKINNVSFPENKLNNPKAYIQK